MDLLTLGALGIVILTTLFISAVVFLFWRRRRYRFSLRGLLVAFALVGCMLTAWIRFAQPIVEHRWAVEQVRLSGGRFLFRADYEAEGFPNFAHSDANHWRDVLVVDVRNDQNAGAVAAQLGRMPEVEGLCFGRGVTDAGLAAICEIGSHPSLEYLNLINSRITDGGLSHLAKLKQIRLIMFNTCPIGDGGLAQLQSLPNLDTLSLVEETRNLANPNRFTEPGFAAIGGLKRLELFNAINLNVSDASARHLHNLKRLKRLRLVRCQISDEAAAALRMALPDCEIEIRD